MSKCWNGFTGCIRNSKIEKAMNVIRVGNIINGAFLIFAGVWGYIYLTDAAYIIYLATYIGCFGFMVMAFELRWKKVENKMRRNFGFMYSPYGRTTFFVFAATLCWAIDLWLPILVGCGTVINAILQCFVFCIHPDFKAYSQVKKTDDPANLPEDEVLHYLKNHPDVAQEALQSTAFAAQPGVPARASSGSSASRAVPPTPPTARKPTAPPARARAPAPAPPRKSAPPAPQPRASAPPAQSDNPFDL